MQSLSRILLPVDFSERSVAAARYAKTLAGSLETELLILHVLNPPQYEFGPLELSGPTLLELYRAHSQKVAADLDAFIASELGGTNAVGLVEDGDPAGKIVEVASQRKVDLIIMPTHGYGPFRRFILGSNTAKVLHDADCPVWTGVHLEHVPAVPDAIGSVLCAVDLGSQSSRTLCWAAALAREFGAGLTVVHVATPDPDPDDAAEVNWRVDVRGAAERELERLMGFVKAEADVLVEAGEPAKMICSAASRVKADVLVIGRGSAAGVFGRLRTNAYAIIRQSPCPVVSV